MPNSVIPHKSMEVVASALYLLCVTALPALSQGISPTVPSKPFFSRLQLVASATKYAAGPGTGILAVTSLTIANFSNTTTTLFIFAPVLDQKNCSGNVIGGGNPSFYVLLEPNKTLQLTFPTPLVFNPIGDVSCIAAEVTTVQNGSVHVAVNGYVQ